MSNFIQTAKARNAAQEAYKKAFWAELRSLKPMPTEEFFVTVEALAKVVEQDRKRGMGSAMHNFFCNNVYQSYGQCAWPFDDLSKPVAWELMARFHNKYEEVKSTLSKKCWELKGLERGDDGYGDLMDSLPLAGRAVVEGLLNDDIANYKQLEKALADHPLKDFILNGENYVEMKMEEKLEEAFLSVVRDLDEDDEDDRPRENPHCVIKTVPIKERDWGDTMGLQINVVGPFRDHYEAEKYAKQEGDCSVVKLYSGTVLK